MPAENVPDPLTTLCARLRERMALAWRGRRAIAYCNEMAALECGLKNSLAAGQWRREAAEYRRLLEKLEPKKKGAAR